VAQDEACRKLAADLRGQRVTVLDRAVAVDPSAFGLGQVEGGEGDAMADDELRPRFQRLGVEDIQVRVEEPGQQQARRPQHSEALSPDRSQVGTEDVRHRVEDEIEAAVAEGAQVPHVAEHGPDGQAVPGGHLLVAGELPGRVVEHGDVRARGGEHRSLLTAAGGEAEHRGPLDAGGEPVAGHGLVPDEDHRPVTGPRAGGHVGPNRPGPLVAPVHFAVPGSPVVRDRIKILAHNSRD
jgi:hypothetical protein